ncbi:MAG: hypothetical protein JWM27_4235 [Gemmatimonadetes bacterium]|nr:hypothetical protein [Gemmatimonadota bacterium]
MRDITYQIYSHVEIDNWSVGAWPDMRIHSTKQWEFAPASSAAVRRSGGNTVTSFRELVRKVAEVAIYNPRLYPLFRGQNEDYLNKAGSSKIYPLIYRPPAGKSRLTHNAILHRVNYLDAVLKALRAHFRSHPSLLTDHREYWWSLLQHYELAKTPLLDLTQNLRLAATFALSERSAVPWGARRSGYVFVLGLPHPPACLSPLVDEQMVIVRLQSVCPPEALRPHFQEGFLIGRWPRSTRKLKGDNAAYRMIDKFRLDNSDGTFWDDGFNPIPESVIYPSNDPFARSLAEAIRAVALPPPP